MAGRVLALDLGTKRIGVAVCDATRTLASPLTTLVRAPGRAGRDVDHRRIAELVEAEEAVLVVVGLPLNMDGTRGAGAEAASREARALTSVLNVPVEMIDERRTTVTAQQQLRAAGRSARQARASIDAVAATVILQHWLGRA